MVKKRNIIYGEKRDNHLQGCKVTYEFVMVQKLSEFWGFSSTVTNMLVEQSILILLLLLRDIGNGFHLLCQLSALPCHFYLIHILFAYLQNFTVVLSSWPVDIGHWSSRTYTINLHTITKTRLQKRKIVVIATFLNFIPKGSGLKRFPWPISQTHVIG